MAEPLTANADRSALLRYLDLKNDLDLLARNYQDLGVGIIAHAMKAHANEIYAWAMLPQRYVAPSSDTPAPHPTEP